MTRPLPLLFSILVSATLTAGQLNERHQPPPQQQPTQPTPEQRDAMLAKMRPGPEHQTLARLEGRWAQEIAYGMGGPQKTVVKGTATNRLILGGRFLISERTAEHPAPSISGERTLDAVNIYGFDRRTNQFTIIELDSMGTYSVSAAGRAAPDGSIVMSGETLDDHGGARETRHYDMVLKIVDADTYTTAIVFKVPGRPDMTIAEGTYRRLK
jgi:hypothetical protein